MIGYTGKAYNISSDILARIEFKKEDQTGMSYLLSCNNINNENFGLIRCGAPVKGIFSSPSILFPNSVGLSIGDVVRLTKHGILTVEYSATSSDNCIFTTNECNSSCVMCPQPPQKDTENFYHESEKIINLLDTTPTTIGITGGEPLLYFSRLISLLKTIISKFPDIRMQLLTNGRILKDIAKVDEISKIAGDNITFCIPLYADHSTLHDSIVNSNGAFSETLSGIYNLGISKLKVEIRTVILKRNIHRLVKLSHFICKNIPYADHVAIMGIEPIGKALDNFDSLWIDPAEYQDEIEESALDLSQFGINTSIFNHQLCTIKQSVWPLAQRSISQWKTIFLPQCDTCIQKGNCCGFFFASRYKHSKLINSINN